MAAKPPKPPVNFMNSKSTKIDATAQNNNHNYNNHTNSNNSDKNLTASASASASECSTPENVACINGNVTKSPTNCSCTNISLMHLFHEMKQEFPTIPDPIVWQCVNENCHQRENCMQRLRSELTLNPIPAQSYPAKVLHPPPTPPQQQQRLQKSQPLRPHRAAPLKPPLNATSIGTLQQRPPLTLQASRENAREQITLARKHHNCDSAAVEEATVLNNNSNSVRNELPNGCDEIVSPTSIEAPILADNSEPIVTKGSTTPAQSQTQGQAQPQPLSLPPPPPPAPQCPPRARPTTLNLQPQPDQQLQRRQFHIQLEQHIQKRNQQQAKPLRKAPLPPLPPKPSAYLQNNNNNNSSFPSQTAQQNSGSLSNDTSSSSCLTSPTISSADSEISVNVSLSSPTSQHHHQRQQLKSPIRHRSVINVQPEAAYTRDFRASPTSNNSPGGIPSNQKSFTSVNLTLRQPNSAVPQSTIDISAGPGFNGGAGCCSGLTYSSTSYDARRGYQKNFHITVTDEGSVFSASRLKPRTATFYTSDHELDDPPPAQAGGVHSPQTTPTEHHHTRDHLRQQQQQSAYPQTVPSNSNSGNNTDMCVPQPSNDISIILQRQIQRRDTLANALRENKKKLSHMEQEICILTEPVNRGESERLDNEIRRFRCDCETMLNEIENCRLGVPNPDNNRPVHSSQQPFQRTQIASPPTEQSQFEFVPTVQSQLDFVQHHLNPRSCATPSNQVPPSPQQYPYLQQYLQQLYHVDQPQQSTPLQRDQPLTPQQQQHQQQSPHAQLLQQSANDEEDDYTDSGESEEPLDMWACNMCTFRNHPQLNICECCENVRISPGTIRIMPNTSSMATATTAAAAASASPSAISDCAY